MANNEEKEFNKKVVSDIINMRLFSDSVFREKYNFILKLILIVGVIAFVETIGLILLASRQPQKIYFAANNDGTAMQLIPLNQPIGGKYYVKNFALTTVEELFSLNFKQYKDQLARVRPRFSSAGWIGLNNEFEKKNFLKILTEKYYTLTVTPETPVRIVQSGLLPDGKYAWKMEFKIILTFDNGSQQTNPQHWLVSTVVSRAPQNLNKYGLVVQSIATEELQ